MIVMIKNVYGSINIHLKLKVKGQRAQELLINLVCFL